VIICQLDEEILFLFALVALGMLSCCILCCFGIILAICKASTSRENARVQEMLAAHEGQLSNLD